MNAHERTLRLAATAIDFELDDGERAALARHLDDCRTCRRTMAAFSSDAAAVASLPGLRLAAGHSDAILTMVLRRTTSGSPLRHLVLAAILALLVAGTIVVGAELVRYLQPSPLLVVVPSPSFDRPAATPSPVEAASELQVTCDGAAVDIATPVVGTQADGVHLHIANTSGHVLDFGIEGQFGGETLPLQGGTYVYTFGPGRIQLNCGASGSPFAVVDPGGLYKPSELTCADASGTTGTSDYAPGAKGPHGSVLDIARKELRGLQPSDVVEQAGYPRTVGDQLVRVVRSGQVVAVLGYANDGHGGWLIGGMQTCGSSKITVVSPKG